jgi:GNAT superfamily N-acetyltransferase
MPADIRPQPDRSDLRPVGPADVPQLARTLARAFEDDPASNWVFPDDARRLELLERGWQLQMEHIWLPHGEGITTTDLAGAACWLPPGFHQPVREQLGLLPAVIRGAGRYTPRVLAWLALAEREHPRKPAHWYLPLLGVDPDRQGGGFGAHLLAPVLERCDAGGIPAYLETAKERNLAFYERHGFAVTKQVKLPFRGPPIWLMWREPSPTDRAAS